MLGLIGLPVGGLMVADGGGLVIGLSCSALYVGLALDKGGS
jgi:hypothetical protein